MKRGSLTHRGGNDPGGVELDGDVGVGDVLLLTQATLDVAQEVVGVGQVASFLWARTDGRSMGFSFYPSSIHFASEAVIVPAKIINVEDFIGCRTWKMDCTFGPTCLEWAALLSSSFYQMN